MVISCALSGGRRKNIGLIRYRYKILGFFCKAIQFNPESALEIYFETSVGNLVLKTRPSLVTILSYFLS